MVGNFRAGEKGIFYSFVTLMVIIGGLLIHSLFGLELGSETEVQIFPYTVFPATDGDNAILSFAFLKNGFELEDNSTQCTFSSLFPVGGVIALNDGLLTLTHDFSFDTNATYSTYGKISGNGNNVYFASTMNLFGNQDQEAVFEDVVLSLCSGLLLQGPLRFTGDYCIIDGYKNKLIFQELGKIIVDAGTTLVLKNLDIEGFSADTLQCISQDSTVILENVQLYQSSDYLFQNGALEIKGVCKITPCHGQSVFTYRSSQPLTIHASSSLTFSSENAVFTYDPASGDPTLLVFESSSASLVLDRAELHVTTTGLQLTGGTLRIIGDSVISSEHFQEVVVIDSLNAISKEEVVGFGVQLGSGNSADDMKCYIKGNVRLTLRDDSLLKFNNVSPASVIMENDSSSLYIAPYATLSLKKSVIFNKGTVYFDDNSNLHRLEDAIVSGNVQFLGNFNSGYLEA